MNIANQLIDLGDRTNNAIIHCNEMLATKGVPSASSVWEVGDRIGEIVINGSGGESNGDEEVDDVDGVYRNTLISLIGGHLEEIEIPDGTNGITNHIFRGNNLIKNVVIPESVSGIGDYAFYECHFLTNINFTGSMLVIGKYAFYNCYNLTELTIPFNTRIESNAFDSCRGLTSVTLNGFNTIGSLSFRVCECLETLILNGNNLITLSSYDALQGTPIQSGTGYIYVPQALLSEYQSATNWSTYSSRFRAIEDYPDIVGG